jgi:hypothetical protein
MPTPAQHLQATRLALNALLGRRGAHIAVMSRLGISADAASALCWLRQSPMCKTKFGPCFTLGFDDDCAGRWLPQSLRSPLDGTSLPVRAVRSVRFGAAQTRIRADNVSHQFLHGTLGAVLRRTDKPSRLMALTAGHVFGAGIGSCSGDTVSFGFDDEATPPITGRLLDWQPNFAALPTSTRLDAAIADVSADALQDLAERRSEWPCGTAWPFADDALRLRVRDIEVAGDSMETVSAWLCVANDTSQAYQIVDALCWRTDTPTQEGDSGAPIWNARDELVAIHAGAMPEGSALNAVAVPIGRILNWAGADIVRRDEPLLRPALARGGSTVPLALPPGLKPTSNATDVLARTIWGEARGEADPDAGMGAVAHVVLNRVDKNTWWGSGVIPVCQRPWQFSCWNAKDPNRKQLVAVGKSDLRFQMANDIATRLLAMDSTDRARSDPTNGATHYFARRLIRRPVWAVGRQPCASIGGHDFFKGIA